MFSLTSRTFLIIAVLVFPASQALAAAADSHAETMVASASLANALHDTQVHATAGIHDTSANGALAGGYDGKAVAAGDISAVPLSAAFWLFSSALIGFIGMSRRTLV